MRTLDKVLGFFGFGVHRVPGRNFDAVLCDVLKRCYRPNEPLAIFDVGAHEGESIDRFMRLAPQSRIYAFEPARQSFARLQKKYGADPDVRLNYAAVGAVSDQVKFNFHPTATGSSSMCAVIDSEFARRRGIPGHVEVEDVQCIALDEFAAHRNIQRINILKIDVQGYESEVLKGAQGLLLKDQIDIVEIEVIIGGAYDRLSSFLDIETFLIENDYYLIACSPDGRFGHGRAFDVIANPELQFDLIYVAPHIHEKLLK